MLIIDDSGDRKDGTATAHVGRQWLGRLGKTDNGIVTVTTVWTDGRVYYPLHAQPSPPPPTTSAAAGPTRTSAPSRRSPPRSPHEARQRASPAGPWWTTAPTRSATTGTSPCATPIFPTSSHSNRTAAPGPAPMNHTPRSTPLAPSPGPAPTIPATRHRWNDTSATGTPRPGGPPTPPSAATARTVHAAWSWPPPTRACCRRRPPGT
ncbi:transposase [Streptomyces rimosus]|uniref:transposase n=1 Tax=Streptomyces rimosus TaxID=1927 RepID=UPI00373AF5C7